jgi:hypothetical protein
MRVVGLGDDGRRRIGGAEEDVYAGNGHSHVDARHFVVAATGLARQIQALWAVVRMHCTAAQWRGKRGNGRGCATRSEGTQAR